MLFRLTHRTEYRYSTPVAEAHLELRLTPPTRDNQRIKRFQLLLDPMSKVSEYNDYFGNRVAVLSLPFRHSRLSVRSEAVIETRAPDLPEAGLDLSIQEVRQILHGALPFIFDYLQPTDTVKIGREASQWARRYLSGRSNFREGLKALMLAVYQNFKYRKGVTDFRTDVTIIWKERAGVCQDFAHVMLSVLRTAGLPARYVCGYIETASALDPQGQSRRLIGSVATHAWVEVFVPGRTWVAVDPTNNVWCGEQHIAVSFGRDAGEATPIRGTFKGSGTQHMKVQVRMRRLSQNGSSADGTKSAIAAEERGASSHI
jgi:transglutaminase-like putative cysteine protease